MKVLIIGGCGFIGSHLADLLVADHQVTLFDNLSIGKLAFVEGAMATSKAHFIQGDILDLGALTEAVRGQDAVVHLAANPEARWGLERTSLDLNQGTVGTYNVLEAMRLARVRRLVFSSSGTVYGDTDAECSELDLGQLPVSLYGASKLAGESMISAFVECFDLEAFIFRFGNVVGPRGTHGAALDFFKKLRDSRTELEVLGNGQQSKPYLHVSDCVSGLKFGLDQPLGRGLEIWNLAPVGATSVRTIAELCVAASPYPDAAIRYTGGSRGWKGDVPKSRMNPERLAKRGFKVAHTSDEAVTRAIRELAPEVFGA